MGSSNSPAPAPAPRQAEPEKKKGSITFDENGGIHVSGDVTSEQLKQAMDDRKARDDAEFKRNSPSKGIDKESASTIAAREQKTLANPKKQKLRGKRTLVAESPLGSGESLG